MINGDLQGLLNKAYFYLKFRLRTVWEMRRYLYKKIEKTHWSRPDAEKIIDYLLEISLLDDKQFINLFIEQRKTIKPKGVYVLEKELLRLGIDKNLVDNYFLDNPLNEEKLAEEILTARWPRFKNLPPKKRFEKAINFLLRRGFNFDISKKTFEDLKNKE